MTKQIRILKIGTPLLLTIILICSYLVRIDPMFLWDIYPAKFLVGDEPVLANLDGYYYLNGAQEIQEGSYSKIVTNRGYPDTTTRPSVPSLVSILIAHISTFTGYSINYVAVFLPAILSLTLFIPLYLWSLEFGGGHIMALTASLFGLTSSIFVNRTYLGFLDTDCLNPTLALLAAYLIYRFFNENIVNRKLIFLFLSFLLYLAFLMWWDQAPPAVLFFCSCPFILGLFFNWKHHPFFYSLITPISVSVAIISPLLINSYSVLDTLKQAIGIVGYISKQENYSFPNVGQTITEQVPLDVGGIVAGTTNNWVLFVLGILGLVWLTTCKIKKIYFLLPVFIIGMFSLSFAMRFTIFFGPLLALGIGFMLSKFYTLTPTYKTFPTKSITAFLVLTLSFSYLFKNVNQGLSKTPGVSAESISGMHLLQSLTPSQSVVWNWWDTGHPLVYWSRRNTINDGMVHDGARNSFSAIPLFIDNYKFAANYMYFYVTHGKIGVLNFIKECDSRNLNATEIMHLVFTNGPGKINDIRSFFPSKSLVELQDFFFPGNETPVYLFLDLTTMLSSQLISWYGSWNAEIGSGTSTTPMLFFDKIKFDEYDRVSMENFSVDYEAGVVTVAGMFKKPIVLQEIVTTDDIRTSHLRFPQNSFHNLSIPSLPIFNLKGSFSKMVTNEGVITLELSPHHEVAIVQDVTQANSIINKLFWRIDEYDEKYFKPVKLNTPHYQIWQITPDTI